MRAIGDNEVQEIAMKVFVPIDMEASLRKSNSGPDSQKKRYVCGYASTPTLDLQNDIVQPSGISLDYFVSDGWINYEHKKGAEYIIGVPTENCYVDFEKGLYVEAMLLEDNKYADDMWNLANSIEKSGSGRKLGFSIEGGIRKRNQMDSRIIEELVVTNVALTTNPVNTEATWEHFMKSIQTGHGTTPETQIDGGALRAESIARAISTLTYVYQISSPMEYAELWKHVGAYLDKADRNIEESAQIMLQLSRGVSRQEAQEFIRGKEKAN